MSQKNLQEREEYQPKIQSWEVADYEDKFIQRVHHNVTFDKKDNGYSMKLYKGETGAEAEWSGVIKLEADNYVKWNFSLQNGAFSEAKLSLNDENNDILTRLYDFYKIWQDEWSKILSLPKDKREEEPENQAVALQEIIKSHPRTPKAIIDNHTERMKKLAGF